MGMKMTTPEQHQAWHRHMNEPVHNCCWCRERDELRAAMIQSRESYHEVNGALIEALKERDELHAKLKRVLAWIVLCPDCHRKYLDSTDGECPYCARERARDETAYVQAELL